MKNGIVAILFVLGFSSCELLWAPANTGILGNNSINTGASSSSMSSLYSSAPSASAVSSTSSSVADNGVYYSEVYLRGSFNGWGLTAMTKSGLHDWSVTVFFVTGINDYKFDATTNWLTNWGDTNNDGVAMPGVFNDNITYTATSDAYYRVSFNDQTLAYSVSFVSNGTAPVSSAASVSSYSSVISSTASSTASSVSAMAISLNSWVNGSIATSGGEDWYSYLVTSGKSYYIIVDDAYFGTKTKTIDIDMTVYRSDMSTVLLNAADGIYPQANSFIALANETIYIKVRNYNGGTSTGSYGIRLSTNQGLGLLTESFESGNVNNWVVSTTGSVPYTVTSGSAYSGTYKLSAGPSVNHYDSFYNYTVRLSRTNLNYYRCVVYLYYKRTINWGSVVSVYMNNLAPVNESGIFTFDQGSFTYGTWSMGSFRTNNTDRITNLTLLLVDMTDTNPLDIDYIVISNE